MARSVAREVFAGHGADVVAIALLVVGLVSGLAVLRGRGSADESVDPVGRVLLATFEFLAGRAAPLLAVGCLVAAPVLLVRAHRLVPPRAGYAAASASTSKRRSGRADDGDVDAATAGTGDEFVPGDESAPSRTRGARLGVGGVIFSAAVFGIGHVVLDPLSDGEPVVRALRNAAGVFGAALGAPLTTLITRPGAIVVLVAIGLLGLAVATERSIVALATGAFAAVRSGVAPAAGAAGSGVAGLFRVADDDSSAPSAETDSTRVGRRDDAGTTSPASSVASQTTDGSAAIGRDAADEDSTGGRRKEPTLVIASTGDATQLEMDLRTAPDGSDWTLPPLTLLSRSPSFDVDTTEIRERGRLLESALSEHGVTTRLVGMVVGPTVTRYELELGVGVKVNSVVNLSKDIAYTMASPDVRIIAPIPGKQAIGVEVPNRSRAIVALGDILGSAEAHRADHPLEVAVGRDIEGKAMMVNLATMPHILIAGQTGAGKSSCINSIMTSILMRATPDEVRLILVDPKRVELTQYNRVPHLLTQVVTNPKKAANALAWATAEMDRRYEILEEVGVRDIGGYNAAVDRGDFAEEFLEAAEGEEPRPKYPRLPFILVVVDELADLMMVAARDVEDSINRIAAKARAVGVHLVIATQRPSVNVITGVIKANIPARFAFAVASATDSKVIIDQGGAERLVGRGDMLMIGPASSTPSRIQGCWVEEREVAHIVSHWRRQAPEAHYLADVQNDANLAAVAPAGSGASGGDDDDLLWQAMELVVDSQLGSTSMLQRKLKVGFARAGRLMDLLEQRGVVGPSTGSKAREVLMTPDEFRDAVAHRAS